MSVEELQRRVVWEAGILAREDFLAEEGRAMTVRDSGYVFERHLKICIRTRVPALTQLQCRTVWWGMEQERRARL